MKLNRDDVIYYIEYLTKYNINVFKSSVVSTRGYMSVEYIKRNKLLGLLFNG